MAIAIRGGSPLVVATVSNPVSGTLDGTRQPQTGDLLVIFHGNDFYTAATMPTPSVGGSTSGVNAVTNGSADAGANQAHVKSYTKEITSTGDVTVSATHTGTADEEKFFALYVLSGADVASPIDGGSAGAAGTFATTADSTWVLTGVTPSGTDALLLAHANSGTGDNDGPPFASPGSPFVEQYDTSITGMSYVGGSEQLSASGATGTRSFVLNAPGSAPWAGVVIAVKTGGAVPAPYVIVQSAQAFTAF